MARPIFNFETWLHIHWGTLFWVFFFFPIWGPSSRIRIFLKPSTFFTWILLFRPHKKTVNSLIYRGYSYNLLCSLRKAWGLNFKRLIAKDSWYTKPQKAFVLNHANCVMLNQSGAPNENIVQNHLNIESLNVF